MLKYIISTLACLVLSVSFAQDTEATTAVVSDTIPAKESYGLRVGLDLSKPIRMLLEDDYKGFEIAADFRLTKKFYLAAELGNEQKTVDEEQINFTTEGSFIKLGFDFNAYENWFGMQNAIVVGMRYGYSTHKQTLNSYTVYQTNQHVEGESILTQTPGTEFSSLNGHWIEVVAGIKVELYDNIYMGFSLRLNRLLSTKEPENFQNLFIPGFNKVTSDSNIGAGFNYTISYSIPIYKKTKKKKEEATDEEGS
ncbi:hypothetical protein H2O64_09025 [Kordia sp. YSTF-M3]|uniref:Outer membrane beta-barrel protein n=1 Tax=Kordia aestuariivivens TaxID=2759037 RepID=A0ABR7Q8B7_9FLAO|nr:DUF6048 family protein [Kordia aestuariivivens]MBC8754811.1 hypothetical protein [Kordia aestuariivivens]